MDRHHPLVSRRSFLQGSGLGFGSLALASLLEQDSLLMPKATAAGSKPRVDLLPRQGHFPAQAKSVIMLFQSG
ncbi:MAG: twin-arginine translocation signal domain-containing protein, partial [Planctomycetota bacterium]|nr:twin-arginine translocation signal domain-containing protein [Planctomycetota bacterium]